MLLGEIQLQEFSPHVSMMTLNAIRIRASYRGVFGSCFVSKDVHFNSDPNAFGTCQGNSHLQETANRLSNPRLTGIIAF